MKIRIGNDIKLKIQLRLSNTEDYVNIQSLQAIFVNATLKNKLECEYIKKNRFIGRFPIEPFVKEFEPTPYNIHSTGCPKYRAFVFNEYTGFGVKPNWDKCFPIGQKPITEYQSEVMHTGDNRIVTVLFPKEAQLFEGVYDLIVVARVYDAGFPGNVRTVTVNYNSVFELVGDSIDATDDPVQIEINNESELEAPQDVYVVAGSYSDDDIELRRNDNTVVNIDISPITGWYEGD